MFHGQNRCSWMIISKSQSQVTPNNASVSKLWFCINMVFQQSGSRKHHPRCYGQAVRSVPNVRPWISHAAALNMNLDTWPSSSSSFRSRTFRLSSAEVFQAQMLKRHKCWKGLLILSCIITVCSSESSSCIKTVHSCVLLTFKLAPVFHSEITFKITFFTEKLPARFATRKLGRNIFSVVCISGWMVLNATRDASIKHHGMVSKQQPCIEQTNNVLHLFLPLLLHMWKNLLQD